MGALAALADRPDHERLAAAHVARGEHLRHRGRVGQLIRLDVAARIEGDAERGLLLIRGAVPGPRGSLVLVRSAAKQPAVKEAR